MKRLLLIALVALFPVLAFSQINTKKPNTFTEETDPNNANFEFYSQYGDSSRRATFNNVRKNMTLDVVRASILTAPDTTGNLSNLMSFVHTETSGTTDSIYIIDADGESFLLYDRKLNIETLSLSGDTLFLTKANASNDTILLTSVDNQDIDTFYLSGNTLYIQLDGGTLKSVSLASIAGVGSLSGSNGVGVQGDTLVKLESDTLTTDVTYYTKLGGGRFRLQPLNGANSLTLTSDSTKIQVGSNRAYFTFLDTALLVNIALNGEFTITDSRSTTSGLEYAADYSAGFTNRTLVDKAYVDGQIAANPGTWYVKQGSLIDPVSGDTLTFVGAGTVSVALDTATNTITLTGTGGGSGVGEANVIQNLGDGTGIYFGKADTTLQIKSLKVGGINSIASTDTTITITATEVDGSTTNEIQTVDSLILSGNTLILTLENDGEAPYTLDLSSINTDNQTVDTLSFAAGILTLALESDGEAPYTVDISGVNTDNQTVDTLSYAGGVITLALEGDGEAPYTVDISAVNTDDQTVDTLSYAAGVITLALEGDGEAPYTVDISGVNTDDQVIDTFDISANTLRLSVESDGQPLKTVDLSPYLDNTDNQTVDTLSYAAGVITLALEGDGEAPYTVDISAVNTDDQTVDTFALSGNTLTLALEGDGEAPYTVDLSSISGSATGRSITILNIGNSIGMNATDTTNTTGVHRFSQRAYAYDYRRDSLGWLVEDTTFNGGAPLNAPPQYIATADGLGIDRVGRNTTYTNQFIWEYLDKHPADTVYLIATGRGAKSLTDSLLANTYYRDSILAHIAEATAADAYHYSRFDYVLLGGYPGENSGLEAAVLAFRDSMDAQGLTDDGTTWFLNDAPFAYTADKWNAFMRQIVNRYDQFVTAYGYESDSLGTFDGVHPSVSKMQEYGKSVYKALIEGRGYGEYADTQWKIRTRQNLTASEDNYVLTYDHATREASFEVAPGAGGGMTSWTLTADGGSNQTVTDGNTVDVAGGRLAVTTVGATDMVTVDVVHGLTDGDIPYYESTGDSLLASGLRSDVDTLKFSGSVNEVQFNNTGDVVVGTNVNDVTFENAGKINVPGLTANNSSTTLLAVTGDSIVTRTVSSLPTPTLDAVATADPSTDQSIIIGTDSGTPLATLEVYGNYNGAAAIYVTNEDVDGTTQIGFNESAVGTGTVDAYIQRHNSNKTGGRANGLEMMNNDSAYFKLGTNQLFRQTILGSGQIQYNAYGSGTFAPASGNGVQRLLVLDGTDIEETTIADLSASVFNSGDKMMFYESVSGEMRQVDYDSLSSYFGGGGGTPGGSNTQLQYNNSGSFGGTASLTYASATGLITYNPTLDEATGDEIGLNITPTINKATSGNYTGIKLNVTETAAPGTDDRLIDLQVGSASKFRVGNDGAVTINDAYSLPTADGAAQRILRTDGAGAVTFTRDSSVYAMDGTIPTNEVRNITLGGTGEFNILLDANSEFNVLGSNLSFIMDDQGDFMEFYGPTGDMYFSNSASTFYAKSGTTAPFQFQDARSGANQRGLEYAADYSANYTSRSLVDKGYVDGQVSSIWTDAGTYLHPTTTTDDVMIGSSSAPTTGVELEVTTEVSNALIGIGVDFSGTGTNSRQGIGLSKLSNGTYSNGIFVTDDPTTGPSSLGFRATTGFKWFNPSGLLLTIDTTGVLTFKDGARQTFNPNGTNAGFNVGSHTADPSSPTNGDVFYNSTSNKFRAYENGAWTDMIGGGGSTLLVQDGTTTVTNPDTLLFSPDFDVVSSTEKATITYLPSSVQLQDSAQTTLTINTETNVTWKWTPEVEVGTAATDFTTIDTMITVNRTGVVELNTIAVFAYTASGFRSDFIVRVYHDTGSGWGTPITQGWGWGPNATGTEFWSASVPSIMKNVTSGDKFKVTVEYQAGTGTVAIQGNQTYFNMKYLE